MKIPHNISNIQLEKIDNTDITVLDENGHIEIDSLPVKAIYNIYFTADSGEHGLSIYQHYENELWYANHAFHPNYPETNCEFCVDNAFPIQCDYLNARKDEVFRQLMQHPEMRLPALLHGIDPGTSKNYLFKANPVTAE